jgi:hypothetical protein
VTLFDFLFLKDDVNVASKSNKQKNCVKKLVFAGILKVSDENNRIRIQDPDPLVRGMDPRIRIRIHPKMSWIRNTAYNAPIYLRTECSERKKRSGPNKKKIREVKSTS